MVLADMNAALSMLRPYGIRQVLTIDSEFRLDEDYRQHVVCVVAHEWPSGVIQQIWLDDLQRPFQFPCGEDTLWVSFVAAAELRSMLALRHPMPSRMLDLYVENRWLHNFQESNEERNQKKEEHFWGLTASLRRFGCTAISADEKEEFRELVLHGGPYTEEQRKNILDYCESDVVGLDLLLPKMLPKIDIRRSIARGSYLIELAKIEDRGIPID